MAITNTAILNGTSTVWTSAGAASAVAPTVNGVATITLTNTSSFIGTATFETSLDGGSTWPPGVPLTSGTMAAGPLTFAFSPPQLTGGLYQTAQHRINVTVYTSGTLTATVVEATVPAANGSTTLLGPSTSTGNVVGVFGGILGSTTNDTALPGEFGEYAQTAMNTVSATGIALTGVGGGVASPAVMTLVGWDATKSFANGQCVFLTNSGGGIGTGLVVNTNYYVCNFNPATLTFNLASTLAKAMAIPATPDLNITIVGTGTQTVHQGVYGTSTSAADVCGLALTPGDWDVDAVVANVLVSTAQLTVVAAWLAQVGASSLPTTSANIFAQGLFQTGTVTYTTLGAMPLAPIAGTLRISLLTPGYVALACQNTFSTAQVNPQGFIRARRVR